MVSVVLENRSIRMFKVSYRSAAKKQHSPSFLSILLLTASLPPSSPSFLSILLLTTSPLPSSPSSSKEGRGSEEDGEEGVREAVRKGEQGSEEDDYFNKFPRQWLQWFLKIDQSECSKSPIDLQQRNNTCVVPHSEHPQS
jgi:hypothetical protein